MGKMDILYTVRHSRFDDLELRYSLRSVDLYYPHVRKVWIFGDRPSFQVDDASRIEHVPHDHAAHLLGCRTPVTNTFLMLVLASLLPELTYEFLWFCDDYVLLEYLSDEEARKTRYLEDLSRVKPRGGRTDLFSDALMRTHALLKRFGYTGWNFESHTPTRLTKQQVLDAYKDFRDFVTEDRFHGPLASTTIINHAYKKERMDLTRVAKEGRRAAFFIRAPSYEEVVKGTRGKIFLNHDEGAFGQGLRRFLAERFPNPSSYERVEGSNGTERSSTDTAASSSRRLEAVFGLHYRTHGAEAVETVSGCGSTVQATAKTREWLLTICRSRSIRSIVDLGCGDWNWMRLVAPKLELDWYRGYDIVPELIEYNRQEFGSENYRFSLADVTSITIPYADLVICRDCLTHLSYEHIGRILAAVKRSGARYFMATTYPMATNCDGVDGPWRPLNLMATPCDLWSCDDSVLEGTWPRLGEKRLALFSMGRYATGGRGA